MFKRKADIEQDFISYGNEVHEKPGKGSLLGMLIQLLSVVILLGITLFMGMFGYKYWQKEFKEPAVKAAPQIAVTAEPSSPALKETSGKKLYTQEEMQAIVTMLMQQMQQQKATEPQPAQAVSTSQAPALQNSQPEPKASPATSSQKESAEATDANSLANQLENAGEDEFETAQETPPRDAIDPALYAAKATPQAKTDTYNKVVVKKHRNSYDDLANLSQKIGNIVETMQHKRKSTYTASIKKEVNTRSREMRVIIVRKGDTLSKIALRAYGSAMAYDTILSANPDLIKNPNHIYVGQRLRVPVIKKATSK